MLDRIPNITQEEHKTFCWFENGYLFFDEKKKQFYQVIEALPIKNIVFSGGGTRGILYAGVINAFEEFYPSLCHGRQNFLSQIETISGASIGSVFAATMAVGIRSEELLSSIGKADFEKLLGTGFGPIKRTADPLYELLKNVIPHTIRKRLNELADQDEEGQLLSRAWLIERCRDQGLADEEQEILLAIHDELEKKSSVINFAMLKALQRFCSTLFKELYIAVVCKENGAVCYFSAENTPELEIALACRASAAVPVIVEPVRIPKAYIKLYANDPTVPAVMSFVDGGLLDNVPFSAVENKQKKMHGLNKGEFNQNLQTLIIFFDDSIAAECDLMEYEKKSIRYSQSPFLNARSFSKHELAPRTKLDFIYNMAPKVIGGININDNYSVKRERIYEQIRLIYSQRNIPLLAGFASAEFAKANKFGNLAIKKSKDLTLAYLNNHQNECIYQSYASIDKLIQRLPGEWFECLIKEMDQIPCLQHFNEELLRTIRANNQVIVLDHFDRFFQAIYQYQLNVTSVYFRELLTHFLIIKKDQQASDTAKMIRALAISLYYYPRLLLYNKILFLLNHKFKKYIQFKINNKINNNKSIENINFNAKHFCLDKGAVSYFHGMHLFYSKFQKIIFVLRRTPSSFINPEDPFKRTFLETIVNDLCDIAAFHLSEKEKLQRMENYIFESYYKILFHQKKPEGVLAQTLKNIIESKAGLNLPYQYGILLPRQINQLPDFNELLKRNYQSKKIIFFKKFLQADLEDRMFSSFSGFKFIKKLFFPYHAKSQSITLFDEVKMQAIVTAHLLSPHSKDKKHAENLYYFIVPSDLCANKKKYKNIFDTISLLSHLSWTKPFSNEKEVYDDLIIDLKCVVLDHSVELHDRIKLSNLLKRYLEKLVKIEPASLFGFFKKSSELLQLIQSFKQQVLFDVDCALPKDLSPKLSA